jgi:hypothetical protein
MNKAQLRGRQGRPKVRVTLSHEPQRQIANLV